MTKKIKTDVRFKSTAQLEKQVAKELSIPDPDQPMVFQNKEVLKRMEEDQIARTEKFKK